MQVKKQYLLLLVSFALNAIVFAQSGRGTGIVKDAELNKPVISATVTLIKVQGSLVLNQGVTNSNGIFSFSNIPLHDSLILKVEHSGFDVHQQIFIITDSVHDFGEIYLTIASKQLDSVIVTGQRSPIVIKKDTIEFNASSFKTAPDAVIEDLIKKLPGIDIDAQGSLTFNGKKISRVLVDGKDFFGADPKIAIHNLPADIVDKIQLMDTRTLEQLFGTSGSNASDEKTLNIKLKEGKKILSSLTSGGGTDKRYEATGMINHFDGPKKWSILGGTNNINKVGFSHSPGADESMQSLSYINEGNGITTSKMAGLHFGDAKENTSYNGSYFFNDALTDKTFLKERRQYIIPDSSFLSNNNSKTADQSSNHRFNFKFEKLIDSTSTFHIAPNISYRKSNLNSLSQQLTTTPGGELINSGENILTNTGDVLNASGSVSWVKKMLKPGRSLFLSTNFNYSKQNTNEENKVRNIFYKGLSGDSIALLHQKILSLSNAGNYSVFFSYSEPISNRLKINISEKFTRTQMNSDRKVFRLDSSGNGTVLDSSISINYTNNMSVSSTNLSLSLVQDKWDATVGASTIYTSISNEIQNKNLLLTQNQFNAAPSIKFHYRIGKNKDLQLNYFAHIQQPTIEQLQPVVDNRNPLLIKEGNPALKPSFKPYYRLNYTVANTKKLLFFTGNINYAPVQNAIVNAVTYNSLGRQFSRFVNVNGNFNSSAMMSFRKGWRNPDTQKGLGLNLQSSLTRSGIFVNEIQASIITKTLAPSFHFQYSYKTLIDITASFSPSFNMVDYSTSSLSNQNFLMHVLQGNLRILMWKDFQVESNLLYNFSSQAPPGFKKDALLINLNMTQQVLKNNRGKLKFTVYDLLKQNNNIWRTSADNYVEDVQAEILQQYFMLSFIYKLDFKN